MTTQIVILAAGMGSRLGRSLPKPLTALGDGRTIMGQQHDNIRAAFGADAKITTVVGYRAETVVDAFPDAEYVCPSTRRTGSSLNSCRWRERRCRPSSASSCGCCTNGPP